MDNDLRLATWNVRSLRRTGAKQEVFDQLKRYRVDIAAVQETRWAEEGEARYTNYTLYYSGHRDPNKNYGGTGFLISSRLLPNVLNFRAVNERICTLRVKGSIFNITLICVYAPTEDKDPDKKDSFYEQLEATINRVPRGDVKVVLGDFNAKVGREAAFFPTIGKSGLHETSNDNGTRLATFAAVNSLVVSSTWFPHKRVHLATWKSPDGITANQIDHVLIEGRHFSSLMDVRAWRGADCDSDHYLVIGKLRTRISNIKKERTKRSERWDIEKLADDAVKARYQEKLAEKLDSWEGEDSMENTWSRIKASIVEATREAVGARPRTKNKGWFDQECADAIAKRNAARERKLQRETRSTTAAFAAARKGTRKILRKKKRDYQDRQLAELQGYYRADETRKFYKSVNVEKKGYQPRLGMCKDQQGEPLTGNEAIKNRWAEYFENLLNPSTNATAPAFTPESLEAENEGIPPPTFEETCKAIRSLKNGKAPGSDGIDAELLKSGGVELHKHIHELVTKIWIEEEIPEEWKLGVICPLYKKGDKSQCANYRGITLRSSVYKVLSAMILDRLKPIGESVLGDYQCGFRPNRSTIDQIFGVRQSMEKLWATNTTLHQLFIDFRQAYDSLNRDALWAAMVELGIPKKYIRIARATLLGSKSCVRVDGELSREFDVTNGVWQGDGLSSLFFNLALERVVRKAFLVRPGTIANRSRQILAYADDIDLMGRSERDVAEAFRQLVDEAAAVGLRVNFSKTKYMTMDNKPDNRGTVEMAGEDVEIVQSFSYLGVNVNSSNDMSEELRNRVMCGSRGQYALGRILRSKNLGRALKIKVYQTILRPVVLYGSETWTLTQADEQMLSVWERKVLRTIFGPVRDGEEWRSRYNHELYNLYGNPGIVAVAKSNRIRWAGHLERMDGSRHTKNIAEAATYGSRRRGRPRATWKDGLEADLTRLGRQNWRSDARDREKWRRVAQDAMTLLGL